MQRIEKITILSADSKSITNYTTKDIAVPLALRLMPLVFLRPKNIGFMKWEYIDFDAALMTIPKEAMKMGKELKVPLANPKP